MDEPAGKEARRWPGWVYDEGEEPDYRFSFANERTYLAWIRTGLALIAAGVALDVVDLDTSDAGQRVAAVTLVASGIVSAIVAWVRWALAERAIRRSRPLPSFGFGGLLVLALVATVAALLVAGL